MTARRRRPFSTWHGDPTARPTLRNMIDATRREIDIRVRYYPRRVSTGRMTEEEQAREIDTMRAVQIILELFQDHGPEAAAREAGERIEAMVDCVRRELIARRKFYPHKIAAGTMDKLRADREVRNFEGVLDVLEQLAALVRAAAESAGGTVQGVPEDEEKGGGISGD